jgi:hypothetical protein
MGKIISTTLNELDQLEKQYSPKNKRPSWNLRNRIGDDEKILFCYYEIREQDILFYVLTDIKLIVTWNGSPRNLWEYQLNEVNNIVPNPSLGIFSSGGIVIHSKNTPPVTVFDGNKDRDFLQSISGSIQKAKANLDVRLRSSTININTPKTQNQDSIPEQFAKLADLYKSGVLTDDEFKRAKEKVLSNK